MLKAAGYYVVSSNEKENCVYKTVGNEFYTEPICSSSEYIEWCLSFCKEHNINVFFPKKNIESIMQSMKKFEDIGVTVICEKNIEMFDILNKKSTTIDFFKNNSICKTPEYRLVSSAEEFKQSYSELSPLGPLCIKYDKDEGGNSFKSIITKEKEPNLHRFREFPENGLSYDYIIRCLETAETFKDIIVMPYLEGPEVSIDCLGFKNDIIAIARYKENHRFTKIMINKELKSIAKRFYLLTKLEGPFNIQLRYNNGELFLLEVNTRLSGGCWKDKLVGCDFPVLCVEKFTGQLEKLPNTYFPSVTVGNIEEALIV